MKRSVFAVLFCAAVTFLIVSARTTGAANGAKAESTVVAGQSDTQHVANGPKGIPPGWEKRVFVHYRNEPARPGGGKPPKSSSTCYGFLARGVKWNNPDDSAFYVDATNSGLKDTDVLGAVNAAAATWADETTANILPPGELATGLSADSDTPDGTNEVVFGHTGYQGAIAVTIVWGIFGGPASQRGITEFDMILETDFDWSIGGSATTMDVQNIVTHELGHAVGLDDMYQSGCSEVTMFGYSTEGETKKRTLEGDDITGLLTLYPLN